MPNRLTQLDYEQLARENQLEWLGETVPRNTKEKTTWRCPQGHIWNTTYGIIKYQGSRCPYCQGIETKSEADYQDLARQQGLIWLGPMPKDVETGSLWRCQNDHEWLASYTTIRLRGRCPWCAKQKKLTSIKPQSEADYHILAQRRGVVWLGPFSEDKEEITRWRCANNHEWLATYATIRRGTPCPECPETHPANNQRKSQADYHALARKRGFVWLGPPVPNNKTKTNWRCSQDHVWSTTYNRIRLNADCPHCTKEKQAPKRKRPEDYEHLAEERGLTWLGPEVKNTRTDTRWQCAQHHVWSTSYHWIRRHGACPICLGTWSPGSSESV